MKNGLGDLADSADQLAAVVRNRPSACSTEPALVGRFPPRQGSSSNPNHHRHQARHVMGLLGWEAALNFVGKKYSVTQRSRPG